MAQERVMKESEADPIYFQKYWRGRRWTIRFGVACGVLIAICFGLSSFVGKDPQGFWAALASVLTIGVIVSFVAFGISNARDWYFRCPRCRNLYFIRWHGIGFANMFAKTCRNCGLRMPRKMRL